MVRLPDDIYRMMSARPAQRVWLTIHDQVVGFDDLATLAGLRPLGPAWVEIDADRALRLLVEILHNDLAYRAEVMPETRAEWLAAEFLSVFGVNDAHYATNSADNWSEPSVGWNPATDFTFDTGLAVVGELGSGLFWVADED